MRRLALPILGALVLAFPAVSAASTTVQKLPFDAQLSLCNGHVVEFTGTLLSTFSVTSTPSGGFAVASHFQPQGISGADEQTGTLYRATGLTRDILVLSPAGGLVETFVNRFHIQATGGAESYEVTETSHITVTPSGTVSVLFDNFTPAC